MIRSPRLGAVSVLSVLLCAGSASAFTIQNAVSDGCHERITVAALRAVRGELATAGPLPLSGDDRAMIDDAPFHVPVDMRDLGGASMLFGVREPDLHGSSGNEIDQLAFVHGDPSSQHEHCLRSQSDDDPDGPKLALAACRAYILQRFEQALDGLDERSAPDPSRRLDIDLSLALRGQVTVRLPVFHLHMGAALHALQDAFTHHLRTDDGTRATTVLNWVEWVNHELDEGRDGPAHLLPMDRCEGHPLLDQRRTLAVDATASLLRAALDPALDRPQKLALATATADQYLGYQPGCTADNRWCDARELDVQDPKGCLCQAPGAGGAGGVGAGAGALLLAAAWLWRRPGRRRLGPGAALASALLLAPAAARAADEAPPPAPPKAPEPKPQSGFALYVAGGGSVDKAGAAAILGGRYRLSTSWIVGLDAEWNPWFNKATGVFRPGAFNGYATLIRQFPLKYEAVNLRTTINAGTSVLLMDLVGAPAGHPGAFGGLSMLGIEWRIWPSTYLVIDPMHIVMPFPQLTGVPFGYVQYRFTLGLEFG